MTDIQRAKNAELGMTCGNFLTALMNAGKSPAEAAAWIAEPQDGLNGRIPIEVANDHPQGFLEVAKVIDSLGKAAEACIPGTDVPMPTQHDIDVAKQLNALRDKTEGPGEKFG